MAAAVAFSVLSLLLSGMGTAESKSVTPRASGWVQLNPGTSWVLRAWCEPGVACNQAKIGSESVVDINWYYTSAREVREIRDMGKVAMCYMSAGAAMPDEISAAPWLPLGKKVGGWEYLRWVDITDQSPLRKWMGARLENAAALGCQAVELDNVDCWQNDCLPGKKPYSAELRQAQLSYLGWLADKAHSLGMAVGQKNSLMLINDLVHKLDFAVNENCLNWNECRYLDPFIDSGKAVFSTATMGSKNAICNEAAKRGFMMKYDLGSNGWRDCDSSTGPRPDFGGDFHGNTNDMEDMDMGADSDAGATWSGWSAWTGCTRVCGSGVSERMRTCSTRDHKDCFGDFMERKTCNDFICHEGWVGAKRVKWNAWSACSKKCGGGVQTRTRWCSTGDEGSCPGDWMGRRLCNTHTC